MSWLAKHKCVKCEGRTLICFCSCEDSYTGNVPVTLNLILYNVLYRGILGDGDRTVKLHQPYLISHSCAENPPRTRQNSEPATALSSRSK